MSPELSVRPKRLTPSFIVPTSWLWFDVQIAAAYEVLADEEKRKLYDQVSTQEPSLLTDNEIAWAACHWVSLGYKQ